MRQTSQCDELMIWYFRLSLADDDGKDESNSISSQRKSAADYCKMHHLRGEVIECVDDGYSGTDFERPGFQKMMLLVKNGNVKTIVIKDLSRFGRNYLEVGYYLEYVLPSYGVRVIAINDNFDSESLINGTVGLEVAIRNLMNEYYSRDISKKISSAVHVKKMKGEYCFGAVPFGYKKGAIKNTIVPDPEAAKIVRYLFSLSLAGLSYSEIAKRMNTEGIITPSLYLARQGSRKNYKPAQFWTYESVRNILTNRIYTGDTEPYKSHVKRVGTDQVKQIPPSEREVIQNTHEALISREEFEKSREVVKITKPKKPSAGSNSILTGFLVCGCCGGRLTKGKAGNRFFLCSNARYQTDSGCVAVRAEEKRLSALLFRAIKIQKELLEEQDAKLRQEMSNNNSRVLALQKELSSASIQEKRTLEKKMRLYEDFVEGKISKEAYMSGKAEFSTRLEEIKMRIALITADIEELNTKPITGEEQSRTNEMFCEITEQELSRDLLSALVEKVIINPDGEVEICWKYMDEMNMEEQENEQGK